MDPETKQDDETQQEEAKNVTTAEHTEAEKSKVESEGDEQSAESEANESPATGEPVVSRSGMSRRRRFFLVSLIILLLAGAGAAAYVLFGTNSTKPAATTNKTSNKPTTPTADKGLLGDPTAAELAADPQLATFVHPKTSESWYATPKKISPLGFVKHETKYDKNGWNPPYYEVGTHGTNKIIMIDDGDVGASYLFFEKSADGKVSWIAFPNPNVSHIATYVSDVKKDTLASSVTVDTTTHYDSLSIPAKLTISMFKQQASLPPYNAMGSLLTKDEEPTKGTTRVFLRNLGQSKLFRLETKFTEDKLTNITYELQLPAGTTVRLPYTPITDDLSTYTWSDGISFAPGTTDYDNQIRSLESGCSSADTITVANAVTSADVVAVGTSPENKTVYAFKSTNNPLIQSAYKIYKESLSGSNTKPDTLTEFMHNRGILLYKDVDGSWLIYLRSKYWVGGCGKPVVYLYPSTPRQINVRVGANVAVSEPSYNKTTGWNAFANPDGSLVVNGKSYGSLFWEGMGVGQYPAIVSGTVVKHADAAATIRRQLAEQGLNQKEANDFMAFWVSKIPSDPYVRLTWFNTAQMNQLAPLHITPEPDTLIRVFLDMRGYDQPVNLPSQRLSSIPRSGFTVVEWGGLLQGRLQ